MLTSPSHELVLSSLEMVSFYHFPYDWVETDWLTVPWILLHVILEDKSEICFSPVLRSLLKYPWLFQDHQEQPRNDNHSSPSFMIEVARSMGIGTFGLFKYSLTWSFSTRGSSALFPPFPPVSGNWDSWRYILSVKTRRRDLSTLVFFHVFYHQVSCPILQWAHIFHGLPFAAVEAFPHHLSSRLWLSQPWCCVLRQYHCAPPRSSLSASTSLLEV